jgi:hypothetical protein
MHVEIWPNAKAKYLVVHEQGPDFVDVTEGFWLFGMFWERSRYDWSQPGVVTQTVIDSNALAPGSTWELRVVPADGSGSRVEMRLGREFGRNPRGRVGSTFNHVAGRRGWGSYVRKTLAAVEQRVT